MPSPLKSPTATDTGCSNRKRTARGGREPARAVPQQHRYGVAGGIGDGKILNAIPVEVPHRDRVRLDPTANGLPVAGVNPPEPFPSNTVNYCC